MKSTYLWPFLILTQFSCIIQADFNQCKDFDSYLVEVDQLKKYRVESTYCISDKYLNDNEAAEVAIMIYDRRTGEAVKEGVVFYNDTIK